MDEEGDHAQEGYISSKRLKTSGLRKAFKLCDSDDKQYLRLTSRFDPYRSRHPLENNFPSKPNQPATDEKNYRTALFPVLLNSKVFAYPDETTEQEIGDLYGRPGIDNDNDTTESVMKK